MDAVLAGLKIAVTRPREQALQFARRIEQAGGRVILFPLLEILPAADPQPLRELFARLHEFDLAIFISPNAVRYGMAAASTLPENLKVASIGQGSARVLRELGVAEVIAPQHSFDSEALLALSALQNVSGWRILIFRGNGGRELLGDTLKARGAIVEYAECYQRLKPQQNGTAFLEAAAHAITVTSSEALSYLWDMFDEAGKARLAAVPLFVPHTRIAEAAHNMGWCNVIRTEAGDDGLLAGLLAWGKFRVRD